MPWRRFGVAALTEEDLTHSRRFQAVEAREALPRGLKGSSRDRAVKAPRLVVTAGVGVALASLFLSAQTPSRPTADRVTDRMAALERESATLAAQSRTLLGEVRKLEVERDLRTLQARQAEQSANTARRELADVTQRLEALEKQR